MKAKAAAKQAVLGCLSLVPRGVARQVLLLLRDNPELADKWGFHLRPIDYYEPLPDFRTITREKTLQRRLNPAIQMDFGRQLELLARLAQQSRSELAELATAAEPDGFDFNNPYFPGYDAAIYYGLIRDLRPKRIIEVGSGYSTRMADKALRRNKLEGSPGTLVCIEPYPAPRLTSARLEMELIEKPVQEAGLETFLRLKRGDLLFIDSSHSVSFGSDVFHEFLNILPQLQPGVWVHVHDIFFPHDYPHDWLVGKRTAWNEQYFLEAFLAYNSAFQPRLCANWLRLDHPNCLEALRPGSGSFRGDQLGSASFWMEKVA